jgi:hypothetical protein
MATGGKNQNYGRPVLIRDKAWNGEGQPKVDRERRGTFHCWGYRRDGGNGVPPVMQTVAIVELEDGRITSKHPHGITFLDRQGPTEGANKVS